MFGVVAKLPPPHSDEANVRQPLPAGSNVRGYQPSFNSQSMGNSQPSPVSDRF